MMNPKESPMMFRHAGDKTHEKPEPWKIIAGSLILPCPTCCLLGDRNGETHIRWHFLSCRDS
jgi:hypothetical protein